MYTLATIGYQGTTVQRVVETLRDAGVALLVDVRAVASSRKPGFSKNQLAANLETGGIDYVHLRDLGTPAAGRAAAHAGRFEEMRRIYLGQLATPAAEEEMETLAGIVLSGTRACLLCFEADPAHCHRTILAETLAARLPLAIENLRPAPEHADDA
ncbi:MAG TPA: DUF488 domain-containing protein [Gemmatimonadales bacterium]|nr:DUF488 domain-containing protein [Gemmatimonadales bacterium]